LPTHTLSRAFGADPHLPPSPPPLLHPQRREQVLPERFDLPAQALVVQGEPGGVLHHPQRLAGAVGVGVDDPFECSHGRNPPISGGGEGRGAEEGAKGGASRYDPPMSTSGHPEPCVLVIFGASGDLTHRKLIPALYELCAAERLPERTIVVGVSRTAMSDDEFREK